MKNIILYIALLCLLLTVIVIIRDPHSPLNADAQQSIVGKPTINAAFINRVLDAAHSPAAGTGETLYNLGVNSGIDPAYALAFFHHESVYGTTGEARVTRSLGNERCITDRPCIDLDRGGYALFASWIDGYTHWYSLILNLYVNQWGCSTVEQIIPRYAPSNDGNDVQGYIDAVETDVSQWRTGQT